MTYRGLPLTIRPSSTANVLVSEPVLGFDSSQPPSDLQPGQSPAMANVILRQGGIEPRPMLTLHAANPQPFAVPVSGGLEVQDVAGNRYPLASGTTTWAWYSTGSWSVLSYVSSFGLSSPPAAASGDYYDFTQIYSDLRDENFAVGANDSYDTLLVWQANTLTFSNLTGAPRAKRVAALDSFLLAANVRSGSSDYVQRIQWNDRGSASSWTGGLSGFADLLDMRGQITRLVPHDQGVLVFSDEETWMGVRRAFPFTFDFAPLDRGVGCPYPWTATQTPLGVIFMSKDYQLYLVPRGGGSVVPIGQRLHRTIRENIDRPTRAWGAFDRSNGLYQFNYAVRGGLGWPQKAVWLDVNAGAWAPQLYDETGNALALSRGFEAIVATSSGTIWNNEILTWDTDLMTWDDKGGVSEDRAIFAGSSAGTLYHFDSTVTSDNGAVVQCRWRSGTLWAEGADPNRMKNVTQVNIGYAATADSNLTLRMSADNGQTFNAGTQVAMGQTSVQSTARVFVYENALQPCVEISSTNIRGWRVFGFQVFMRQRGR